MEELWHIYSTKVVVLYKRTRYTCQNLTVHGPSFLFRKDVHFIFKLIYFVIYINVWVVAAATVLKYYSHYEQSKIRFTTRTDYLDWNTTFPSVTVCEVQNFDKIATMLGEVGQGHVTEKNRFIEDIAFFSGTCFSCDAYCENNTLCVQDYSAMAAKYRTECEKLFVSCKWNGEPISCCKHFKPIQTEYGLCYSMNNKHTQRTQGNQQYIAATKTDHSGALELVTLQDYEAFLHSPEDIPFWNMEYDRRLTVLYAAEATVSFSIIDVMNEPEVSMIPPEVRQCRFSHELPNNFVAYKHYSYSVCIIQCRIEAQLKLCNCTHHLSPGAYKESYCDLEGLKCLTGNFKSLRKLKVPDTDEAGLDCDCLPSCTEPDYNVVSMKIEAPKREADAGRVVFMLANLPYQRVTRQVARTALDLVVAMGNCFGLCFGGSLLSIVEIVYYLCFKRWK